MLPARDFWTLIETGGWAMYPLLLCSVASLSVVIERAWVLARAARAARRFHRSVSEALAEGAAADALAIIRRDGSLLGGVYRALATQAESEEGARVRLAEQRHTAAVRELKRHLWLVGTIGSLAPFVGLFGTVLGIVRAFESMAVTGSGGFAVVAAGISEALVATAAGLAIGVVSIFFYNAFQVRIANLAAEWRECTAEIAARLSPLQVREGGSRVAQAR